MIDRTEVFEDSWQSRASASFKWYYCRWNESAQINQDSRRFVILEIFLLYVTSKQNSILLRSKELYKQSIKLIKFLYKICSTLSLSHFIKYLARSQQNTKLSACQRNIEVESIYNNNTSKNASEIYTQIFVNKNLRLNNLKSEAVIICD